MVHRVHRVHRLHPVRVLRVLHLFRLKVRGGREVVKARRPIRVRGEAAAHKVVAVQLLKLTVMHPPAEEEEVVVVAALRAELDSAFRGYQSSSRRTAGLPRSI